MENSESMASEAREMPPFASTQSAFKVWQCILCGFTYDEAAGMPGDGVAPGTTWADVPDDWLCPECSAQKMDFEMVEV